MSRLQVVYNQEMMVFVAGGALQICKHVLSDVSTQRNIKAPVRCFATFERYNFQ